MLNTLFAIGDVLSPMVTSLKSLGVWYQVILNAFGVIAIILKVTEFQLKNRKTIIIFALIGSACWVFYFFFNGDLTSTITGLIGTIQGLIFLFREKYKWAGSKFWLYFFIVVQLACGIFTFSVWHDVFALSAGVFNVLTYFVLERRKYRIMGFFLMLSWVLNSVFKFYPIALINDVFAFISVCVAIIRYDLVPYVKEKRANKLHSEQTNEIEEPEETQKINKTN